MSVFIYQPDALALMAKLEGQAWHEKQKEQTASSYAFPIWLEAWKLKVAAGFEHEDYPLEEFIQDRFKLSISPVIYGDGGYHRYLVNSKGELLFSRMHSVERRSIEAAEIGFTVY